MKPTWGYFYVKKKDNGFFGKGKDCREHLTKSQNMPPVDCSTDGT